MKTAAVVISVTCLIVIIGASVLVFRGLLPHAKFVVYTNISTLLWFLASPFWLAPKKKKVK